MERLNSIQQDPLDVVGKNVDLVMQSRVIDYQRQSLEPLLYQDRLLIDGWDKMMAVYLTKDFPKLEEVRLTVAQDHKHVLAYRNQLVVLDILDEVFVSLKDVLSRFEFYLKLTNKNTQGFFDKSVLSAQKLIKNTDTSV